MSKEQTFGFSGLCCQSGKISVPYDGYLDVAVDEKILAGNLVILVGDNHCGVQ
jgi:hypothetical protein